MLPPWYDARVVVTIRKKRVPTKTAHGRARVRAMTKQEARAFVRRWALVNAREREELRATPPEQKLRQVAALMASVHLFGWDRALAAEEDDVRSRWVRLKHAYGG